MEVCWRENGFKRKGNTHRRTFATRGAAKIFLLQEHKHECAQYTPTFLENPVQLVEGKQNLAAWSRFIQAFFRSRPLLVASEKAWGNFGICKVNQLRSTELLEGSKKYFTSALYERLAD